MKKLLFALPIILAGCSTAPSTVPKDSETPLVSDDIRVESVDEAPPKFKVHYIVQLDSTTTLDAEYEGPLYKHGPDYWYSKLIQSDEKWISFEIENPADRLISSSYLADVEKYSKLILQKNEDWKKGPHNSFKDEDGVQWIRANALYPSEPKK